MRTAILVMLIGISSGAAAVERMSLAGPLHQLTSDHDGAAHCATAPTATAWPAMPAGQPPAVVSAKSATAPGPFRVTFRDWAGRGFLSEAAPDLDATGNAGATLGEQRQAAVLRALEVLAPWIDTPAPIGIELHMLDGACMHPGVLAWSGPTGVLRFGTFGPPVPAGLRPHVYYPVALIRAHMPSLDMYGAPDIRITINAACDADWWLGVDDSADRPTSRPALLTATMHEVVHALGVYSTVCMDGFCNGEGSGGWRFSGGPDVFSTLIATVETDARLVDLDAAERASLATTPGALRFTGPHTLGAARDLGIPVAALDLHTPHVFEAGSSLSHLAAAGLPLLMAPRLGPEVFDTVDLAPTLLYDLGWPRPTSAPAPQMPRARAAAELFQSGFEE